MPKKGIATMAHTIVKPEKLVQVAAAALEQNLVIPALFRREGIDKFRGAKDDTINVVVDGVLPYRTYGWRNNRSTSITFDEYTDRKVALNFGDDIYSAVKLTDEQSEMDFNGWAKLVSKQAEAIGRGLEYKAVDAFEATPFEVVVTLNEADLRGGLILLRQVFNKLQVPGERTIIAEADLEAALLADSDLAIASSVGDRIAENAAQEAIIGRRLGFNIVTANEMNGFSVAATPGAYIFYTAAPSVPASVPFGASASVNGVALRWVRSYDLEKMQDRSLLNAYHSFRYVDDPLVIKDGATNQAYASTTNHFVRAVKVVLGGANTVEIADDELAEFTGMTSTDGVNDGS
jgi:hypothetical protein